MMADYGFRAVHLFEAPAFLENILTLSCMNLGEWESVSCYQSYFILYKLKNIID